MLNYVKLSLCANLRNSLNSNSLCMGKEIYFPSCIIVTIDLFLRCSSAGINYTDIVTDNVNVKLLVKERMYTSKSETKNLGSQLQESSRED